MTDKITINKVDIGINISEEIKNMLNSEISKETINELNDLVSKIADRPENKKAIEKIDSEKKLEEMVQIILINGKITKDEMTKLLPNNKIISTIGLLRNYSSKYHNKELIKQKDYYKFVD
jgi:hypothetical protein